MVTEAEFGQRWANLMCLVPAPDHAEIGRYQSGKEKGEVYSYHFHWRLTRLTTLAATIVRHPQGLMANDVQFFTFTSRGRSAMGYLPDATFARYLNDKLRRKDD